MLHGKGFFIWKIPDCEQGDPQRIACTAQEAGLTHVLVKIADGNTPSNIDNKTRIDLIPPVVDALRQLKIQTWGWHYVYGYDPLGEANIAAQRVKELGLDGYVIDAEIEYTQPGKEAAARQFISEIRGALSKIPIALSSFRFPSYHPQLPWRTFLEQCDYNMPQVYWERAHNPAEQFDRVIKEFQGLTPFRPVIPTGPTYKHNGWKPTETDLHEFLKKASESGLSGVNFFSWDESRRNHPDLWDVIARYNFSAPPPEHRADITERYIQALNQGQPEQVAALYHPSAVHITAARTIQGAEAIQAWYSTLFEEQLPEATFSLTGSNGLGPYRRFTWQAESSQGKVANGSDTFGVKDGKIVYHYASFAIH